MIKKILISVMALVVAITINNNDVKANTNVDWKTLIYEQTGIKVTNVIESIHIQEKLDEIINTDNAYINDGYTSEDYIIHLYHLTFDTGPTEFRLYIARPNGQELTTGIYNGKNSLYKSEKTSEYMRGLQVYDETTNTHGGFHKTGTDGSPEYGLFHETLTGPFIIPYNGKIVPTTAFEIDQSFVSYVESNGDTVPYLAKGTDIYYKAINVKYTVYVNDIKRRSGEVFDNPITWENRQLLFDFDELEPFLDINSLNKIEVKNTDTGELLDMTFFSYIGEMYQEDGGSLGALPTGYITELYPVDTVWTELQDVIININGIDRLKLYDSRGSLVEEINLSLNFPTETVLIGKHYAVLNNGMNTFNLKLYPKDNEDKYYTYSFYIDYKVYGGNDNDNGYNPPSYNHNKPVPQMPSMPNSATDIIGWLGYLLEWIIFPIITLGWLISTFLTELTFMFDSVQGLFDAIGSMLSFLPPQIWGYISLGALVLIIMKILGR